MHPQPEPPLCTSWRSRSYIIIPQSPKLFPISIAGRGEVSLYRIHRRTRHCGAHVVCIGHAFVDYPADHAAFYSYAALIAEQQGTGARNGAL